MCNEIGVKYNILSKKKSQTFYFYLNVKLAVKYEHKRVELEVIPAYFIRSFSHS